jgi:hypothetical protein
LRWTAGASGEARRREAEIEKGLFVRRWCRRGVSCSRKCGRRLVLALLLALGLLLLLLDPLGDGDVLPALGLSLDELALLAISFFPRRRDVLLIEKWVL